MQLDIYDWLSFQWGVTAASILLLRWT